jgi:hypothetical protein
MSPSLENRHVSGNVHRTRGDSLAEDGEIWRHHGLNICHVLIGNSIANIRAVLIDREHRHSLRLAREVECRIQSFDGSRSPNAGDICAKSAKSCALTGRGDISRM